MWLSAARPATAGGGPENVLLVINSNSDSSKAIANYYIELRKIPPQNVLYVDWRASLEAISGKVFRERLLMPTLKAIEERRLGAQIDYVVYSSDFPWRIDLQALFPDQEFPGRTGRMASLTGATYLTPLVVSRIPAIAMPSINWYVPGPVEPNQLSCTQLANVPTRGFRSRYLWDKEGKHTKDATAGQRYLLSTTLGVTQGRGNTVEEVLSYLRRAAKADGTRPAGTIYFMANNNIRSKTRDKCFAGMASEIARVGVRATVVKGTIPRNAKDVIGLMAGVASFDWAKSGSVILPGAICEHLTSYGGDLSATSSQTPLSEFLRHGAAGASGTVAEPWAIQAKFPLPSLQLHYVRGSSLAEAFYQSVSGPYQLLIVGDPLCQPWAKFPHIAVEGVEAGQEVSGPLSITPSAVGGRALSVIDLFVDGRLAARSEPGTKITIDTTKLADGYHELRLVGADAGPLETQGRQVVPITVNNRGTKLVLTVSPLPAVGQFGHATVSVRQTGATAIAIRQNSRQLARVQGEAGEVEIAAATFGRGPTTLQAFSEGDAAAVSAPVRIQVE